MSTRIEELTQLPAFIEEALSNVSLSAIIAAHLGDDAIALRQAMQAAVDRYAREWIDDTMARLNYSEAEALDYGLRLFSSPVTGVGL